MSKTIKTSTIREFRDNFSESDKHPVLMNSVVKNGIQECGYTRETEVKNQFEFSISLNVGKVTNQKKSGRCWMFAALNIMRLEVMKKLNLENMELSQAYPLFWDKLEKSNFFLENILETMDEEVDGRVVSFLLLDPLADGGQWDMFANLIRKYGVVPKEAMPESKSSSDTVQMDKLLTTKLRGYACELRKAHGSGESMEELRRRKEGMLNTLYRMLCISLGEPPQKFTYETRDKDDKFIRISDMEPREFYEKYVGLELDQYVSIINAPTADKPYHRTFTVQYLGNVREGERVLYLNLPSEELKRLAVEQLKQGESVWFGSDVDKFSSRETGIMAMNAYDYEGLFSTDFPMDKAERLDFGESLMTHAMVLTGVNIDEQGNPNRWRVENSWGEDRGRNGFFVMSDDWFDQYTYQIVIHKKFLSGEQLKMLKAEPIVLKPWDPIGSLAK